MEFVSEGSKVQSLKADYIQKCVRVGLLIYENIYPSEVKDKNRQTDIDR